MLFSSLLRDFSVSDYTKYLSYLLSLAIYIYSFPRYFPNNPNPPCQLSLWEEIGEPGENPRLSAECWRTPPTCDQHLSWNALEYTALFLWDNRTIFLYNKQNNTSLFGNMKLFLVLNRISHSFALLTREISWSTLEINFIFPHIHVLFSIYCIIRNCIVAANLLPTLFQFLLHFSTFITVFFLFHWKLLNMENTKNSANLIQILNRPDKLMWIALAAVNVGKLKDFSGAVLRYFL